MKKNFFIFFILIFCLAYITACGKDLSKDDTSKKEEATQNSKTQNGDNVEVTIPSLIIGVTDFEEFRQKAIDDGMKDVLNNKDNTITFVMDKEYYQDFFNEIKEELNDYIEFEINDDITEIKPNENYDEITLLINKEEFEKEDWIEDAEDITLGSWIYQCFNGVNINALQVKYVIKDNETNQELDTIILTPEELKKMIEESEAE